MTREDVRSNILNSTSNYILAELTTSLGKSRVALEFMHDRKVLDNILIVIPRKVLKKNWKEEFDKWGYSSYFNQVTFTTYISLPKYINKPFNLIIFDECHHLSARARDAVCDLKYTYCILLSATITLKMKTEIKALFPGIDCFKVSLKQAIDEGMLPDPKVYLVPLSLDTHNPDREILVNNKPGKVPKQIYFKDRFKARKDKNNSYLIKCTQKEYYQDLDGLIEFYKKNYFKTNNSNIYYRWQRAAKDRLLWLSNLKNDIVLKLLESLKDKRTLTFCSGIEQTKILGKYCINSQEDKYTEYLDDFNNGKINHITACEMLNEGVNLVDCQIGIFASINSSDIMIKQKNGRILRHSDPIIYIIYYRDTREQELVEEIIKDYNPNLITVVDSKQL